MFKGWNIVSPLLPGKGWRIFFSIIDTLVEDEHPWQEKVEEIRKKAKEYNSEENFEEFLSWFKGL